MTTASCSLCAAGPSCPVCGTALTAVQLPGRSRSEACESCGYSRQASFPRDLERHSLMCETVSLETRQGQPVTASLVEVSEDGCASHYKCRHAVESLTTRKDSADER